MRTHTPREQRFISPNWEGRLKKNTRNHTYSLTYLRYVAMLHLLSHSTYQYALLGLPKCLAESIPDSQRFLFAGLTSGGSYLVKCHKIHIHTPLWINDFSAKGRYCVMQL